MLTVTADASSIYLNIASTDPFKATVHYLSKGKPCSIAITTETTIVSAKDIKVPKGHYADRERVSSFTDLDGVKVIGTGKCPWDRTHFHIIPGYEEGYGCPLCKGLSYHLEVEYL